MGRRRPIRSPARRAVVAAVLCALAALASCGDEDTGPTTAPTARSAEDVAALLLTPQDLGDGWSTRTDPTGESGLDEGVVTDDNRDLLPRFEQCASADEPPQSAPLHWDAFRQLDLATQVTGKPPGPGVRPTHHLFFVQELILADDPSAVTTMFADLEEEMTACIGRQSTSDDGEEITSKALEAPAVGDEAAGLRYIVTEPGGAGGPVWDLRDVVYRDGDLLVALSVVEIASPTIERALDDAELARIVQAAHDATT